MTGSTPTASTADVLRLIQHALDEFETVPLEASIRRAIRIANLLGETYAALRLSFEIKPTGGHPAANADMTRRLMADPGDWDDTTGVAQRALDEFMNERRRPDGMITSHPVSLIEYWQRERVPSDELAPSQYESQMSWQLEMLEIHSRARHKVFTYLCSWERQVTFAVNQNDALAAVSQRVDALLSARAPDALDRFNVAFRRLREAAAQESAVEADEELSQALASCRRILKTVVDYVQPVDPDHRVSDDGHELTDAHYKNRLVEFLKERVASESFRGALGRHAESLFQRFTAVDDLASKGVHASVAVVEADFCALATYTLAGEVLTVMELDTSPED